MPATTPGAEMTHRQILEVLVGLMSALFVAIVSATIVSTALPTIIADLDGTQTQYTWVVTASLLAMTVTSPIWSKLSDLYDKKVLVQIAIGIFLLGSLAALLAGGVDRPGMDLAALSRMFGRLTENHARRMAELGLAS